jgi:uncharacterized protein YejL (UPF0352 family)
MKINSTYTLEIFRDECPSIIKNLVLDFEYHVADQTLTLAVIGTIEGQQNTSSLSVQRVSKQQAKMLRNFIDSALEGMPEER